VFNVIYRGDKVPYTDPDRRDRRRCSPSLLAVWPPAGWPPTSADRGGPEAGMSSDKAARLLKNVFFTATSWRYAVEIKGTISL
jgi:hypothetical protein